MRARIRCAVPWCRHAQRKTRAEAHCTAVTFLGLRETWIHLKAPPATLASAAAEVKHGASRRTPTHAQK